MNVAVLGAGLMGRAILYDLLNQKTFDTLTVVDINQKMLFDSKKFFSNELLTFEKKNAADISSIKQVFKSVDLVISALPYYVNYNLTKLAIKTGTHFIDLGGNHLVVNKQKQLHIAAKNNHITVIPDSGLAPGLVSVITRDIVDSLSEVDLVQLRVGGLPLKPQPPFNYQIVFSIEGLINEYVENAMILDNGSIKFKPSMTDIESLYFPEPFGCMEAFLTSGGCSTLPYTYQHKIKYLDYKTIRYPGHCDQFKNMLDIGLGNQQVINIQGLKISPREVFIQLLKKAIPTQGPDVVLLKVIGKGKKHDSPVTVEYTMIDQYDHENGLSAMMRSTGFPVAITAELLAQKVIADYGVFSPEEIIPPSRFFKELQKRRIIIKKIES